jgi:hypothetical protein
MFLASPAAAAQITPGWVSLGQALPAITISGPIVPGDTLRFVAAQAVTRRWEPNVRPVVALDSPGGNILESRALATLVAQARLDTVLGPNATCASACAIVFFAGVQRVLGPGARIGVHRASTLAGAETPDTLDTSLHLAKALLGMGASQRVIDKLMATAPGHIAWLTAADLGGLPSVTIAARPTR